MQRQVEENCHLALTGVLNKEGSSRTDTMFDNGETSRGRVVTQRFQCTHGSQRQSVAMFKMLAGIKDFVL